MAHHGMNAMHGINAMCKNNDAPAGRFGRIFPKLQALYTAPTTLKALGKQGGPMDGGRSRNATSTIPMGFVFLGQFIDHDITLDTTSGLDRVNDVEAIQNFRTPCLDLDCIYGNGPEASNFLYKDGVYLLTGKDGTALASQSQQHRNNDLVRSSEGTAIIGDPRNDENRIVSQLQLAFINFHNAVVDYIKSTENLRGKELFEEAKRMVRWHYHWIILNEFLPTIIGQPRTTQIMSAGRQFYRASRPFIPIEFAAAAYRFGHSLASQQLRVQKAQPRAFDLFGRALGRGFSPITDDRQVVEWETMFAIDNAFTPQRTDKLDTKLPTDLLALPFIPSGEENSLATRNLLRGNSFLLPSGENIARAIGVPQADIDKVNNFVKNNTTGLDFSNGTPLWYYILAEAECIGRLDAPGNNRPGEGLGQVGATIIGETLIGLIELDATSFLSVNRNWHPTLSTNDDFTMADLLTFSNVPATV